MPQTDIVMLPFFVFSYSFFLVFMYVILMFEIYRTVLKIKFFFSLYTTKLWKKFEDFFFIV